jgi:hypothetical protein
MRIFRRPLIGSGDPYFSKTVLLMHAEGPDGTATFKDNSPRNKTISVNNAVTVTTAQKKYGATSFVFDGAGDSFTYANSTDFGFGTGDFTVETWFYRSSDGIVRVLFDFRDAVATEQALVVYFDNEDKIRVSINAVEMTSATAATGSAWHHLAVTRQSGTLRIFTDGVLAASGTFTNDIQSTRPLSIGARPNNTATVPGYMDEIRITKGVARYTANFTPPSTPFPNS